MSPVVHLGAAWRASLGLKTPGFRASVAISLHFPFISLCFPLFVFVSRPVQLPHRLGRRLGAHAPCRRGHGPAREVRHHGPRLVEGEDVRRKAIRHGIEVPSSSIIYACMYI